ncbi:uncharacterized protein LOC116308936 [Actinia tenebrosa]|uniref:Uncharacterized protein LOC116308936 n=1 Tax=Actinia tenebrosa TaxID=6105 RepID=A0A6P8JG99_ACTTE|nr:uncharacterized protein LOC116308936 [Actinia tenebrosa]
MECKTVSMTLDVYGGRKHSDYRSKVVSKKIEDRKQEVSNLRTEELLDLTNGIDEPKGGKETLSKTLDEDSRLDSLEKAVEQNKIDQEKEMKEFNEWLDNGILEVMGEFEKYFDEADYSFKKENATEMDEVNKRLNQDKPTLKNNVEINYCQSYIGRVCWILQAIMYHIVLPDQFSEDWLYKVKDIEKDINDEDLLDDQERQEALERWVDLKEKLCWEPSIEKTLKMLQKEGNYMANPEGLTVEEAERVAEELNKQGRLRGRTSYEKVKKIIKMWKISTTLLQSLP